MRPLEIRHPARALVATVTLVLVGATTAALSSPTPARAFWIMLLGAVALLVVPFAIATVVHVRARRRHAREHDTP
ncbi:hypothetical protein [Cellulomonas sp. PS-H5]|uniref:hypothetical protein n=1 Tax=Cellulomonas sp. PS-H5 TaxID=2820400 RepID=UPI001C4FA818|nr:hypothetical protein [Cellulomonas sp. PS-H5]MBW0253693.1 hypothetical protein [Cellulomonas sp. PS-H5]